MAITLLRHRIVEDFTHDTGLKLGVVSAQISLVLGHVVGKLRPAFSATAKLSTLVNNKFNCLGRLDSLISLVRTRAAPDPVDWVGA